MYLPPGRATRKFGASIADGARTKVRGTMLMRGVGFLLSVCVILYAGSSQAQSTTVDCIKLMQNSGKQLDVCKKNLCFTFTFEPPFVHPDSKLANQTVRPFQCRSRGSSYPELRGLFFDSLDALAEKDKQVRDAQCVFVGNRCTSEQQVQLLSSGIDGQLIAGGHIPFVLRAQALAERNQSVPNAAASSAVSVQSVFLVSRSSSSSSTGTTWQEAGRRVFRPFSGSAWVVIVVFAVLIPVCFVIYAHCFYPGGGGWTNKMSWMMVNRRNENETPTCRSMTAWLVLCIGASLFLALIVLVYIVSASISLFQNAPVQPSSSVAQLDQLTLKNLAVVQGGSSESILQSLVATQDPAQLPWKRAATDEQLIQWVSKSENGVSYGFITGTSALRIQQDQALCLELNLSPLRREIVGGWYFGANVPVNVRTRINEGILGLTQVRGFAIDSALATSTTRCQARKTRVEGEEITLLFLFLVVPFLLVFLFLLFPFAVCCSFIRKRADSDEVSSYTSSDEQNMTMSGLGVEQGSASKEMLTRYRMISGEVRFLPDEDRDEESSSVSRYRNRVASGGPFTSVEDYP